MVRFETGEEKELELWCEKCKAFTDEKHTCKNCKKCGTDGSVDEKEARL